MFSAGSSGEQQLKDLEVALRLDWDDQDWGLVNADPSRVLEFTAFFEQNYDEQWSAGTVAEFVDLVLESASEAMREDPRFPIRSIDQFLTLAAPLVPTQMNYWTSRDWPITAHLRELGF